MVWEENRERKREMDWDWEGLLIERMDGMCEKYGRESVSILKEKKNNWMMVWLIGTIFEEG